MTVDRQHAAPSRVRNGAQKAFTGIHTFFYRISGGRMGGKLGQSPVVLLTTTGRKSGKKRTRPLFYLPDGENLALIASNGGAATHPTWWLNMQANPHAEVQVGRKAWSVTARQATAEERERLWPQAVAMYAEYANYQKRTSRDIPVVILQPTKR